MKKKLLMITPENQEINRFRKRQFNNFVQITMPYLAAFVDQEKYLVTLVDEYNQKTPFDRHFDLVAITVNTSNAAHCYRMSEKFREMGAKVVFGGPHVTLLPDEAMEHCDYLIVGEAEQTWPQFLSEFYNGECEKKLYQMGEIPFLAGIPIPRRDLIHKRFFTKGAVISSRGCPYHCAYCNLKQIYHDSFRTRPIAEVIEDIRQMKSKYFVFWDDNFFGDIRYAKALMKELKGLNKRWAAQVTLERCRDQELLQLAKESGCIYFFVGIESFSEESLQSVNKRINNVAKYEQLIGDIHRHGISVQAGIIFGFDTDNRDVFKKTLDACNHLGIDGVTVSILTPLPKTPVYEQYKREGRLLTDDWSAYNGKTRVAYQPKQMTAEELFEGYMWFRKEFYSWKSICKRMKVSRVNLLHNLLVNLGYKISIKGTYK
ncbi:radical SAM protein [Neobacillus sp. OS1-32]|uniref:B12-binding domain-containing radical SAM protein n=1 Tax=Neobacillus sp. OS1-32 TaxID=3070682 RepID=UPI0027E0ACD0|nr:radical SAM protein [Neobacillus sp. OS1-32]WML29322.1 radical SAM protein [Neobacillus sp. OS1-32]